MGEKSGFILVEILVSLVLLGLVAMAGLPAMAIARSNLNKASEKGNMVYLCELAAETLKTDDPEIMDYLEELLEKQECVFADPNIDENKYICTVKKLEYTGEYLSIEVTLESTQYDDMEVHLEISRQYKGVLPD